MFTQLKEINLRPAPFEFYTTETLWNDPHISKQMLNVHLDEHVDSASRNRPFIDRSIAWIADHFSIHPGTRVCDFGCGPGLYTQSLAQYGCEVTGLDFSQNSLAYARQKADESGKRIRYVFGNYLDYRSDEKYDLILMIMCDFCVLSPAQRVTLLQNIHSLLADGGVFLFDVYSIHAFDRFVESASYTHRLMDGFWAEGEYYGFLNSFKYPDEKVTLDKYTLIEPHRSWTVYNWLQYFCLEELTAVVDECGFSVTEIFSDVAGTIYQPDSNEFAVLVRKK